MTNANRVTVELPGGYWHEGQVHRSAELRPLDGADEIFVADKGHELPAARLATALLTRCLTRLGPLEPATEAAVRTLAAGDREALLLHLRRLTLGDALGCVLTCPSCETQLDLELRISDLLVSAPPRHDYVHEATIEADGQAYHVRFRVPDGTDQEWAALQTRRPPEETAAALLRRCVAEVRNAETGENVASLPPVVAAALPGRMAELDPQSELRLDMSCIDCDHAFTTYFDTTTYLRNELQHRARRLFREVHLLALYYHWSEQDILRMMPYRRQMYLDLIDEAISR